MKYFAYGSNLSLKRIRNRIDVQKSDGIYMLPAHDLRFHKQGRDNSAKCDAYYTGDDADNVLGILYEIDPAGKSVLDKIEDLGSGYAEKEVTVYSHDGEAAFKAFTYYAILRDDGLQPYRWYLEHVITGAVEAGMPPEYIEQLRNVAAREDPDRERARRERLIYNR